MEMPSQFLRAWAVRYCGMNDAVVRMSRALWDIDLVRI